MSFIIFWVSLLIYTQGMHTNYAIMNEQINFKQNKVFLLFCAADEAAGRGLNFFKT